MSAATRNEISDQQIGDLEQHELRRRDFHGEWNYTRSSRNAPETRHQISASGGSPALLASGSAGRVGTVVGLAVERYLADASLIAPAEECLNRCNRLMAAGVDEIACLVDFIPDQNDVLDGVRRIATLKISIRSNGSGAMRMAENFIEPRPDSS